MSIQQMMLAISGGIPRSGDLGSEVDWDTTGICNFISTCYDSTRHKIICAYRHYPIGGSQTGKVVVGTVDGDSITWSSPQTFYSGRLHSIAVEYDPVNDVILFFYTDTDNSSYPTGKPGQMQTANSDTITFGSSQTMSTAGQSQYNHLCFDTNIEKFVCVAEISNQQRFDSAYCTANSNNSISFGSTQTVEWGSFGYGDLLFDPDTGKYLWAGAWTDYNNPAHDDDGGIWVGQPNSGNSQPEWGSFNSLTNGVSGWDNHARDMRLCYDTDNNKAVVSLRLKEPTGAGLGTGDIYASVVTVSTSALTCTYGTPVFIDADTIASINESTALVYDPDLEKVITAYGYSDPGGDGHYRLGTISGTSISFATAVQFSSDRVNNYLNLVYDSENERTVFCWPDKINGGYANEQGYGHARVL